MFRNHHYYLHYKLLLSLIQILKDEQTKKIDLKRKKPLLNIKKVCPEYEELLCHIESIIQMPTITEAARNFLDQVFELPPK